MMLVRKFFKSSYAFIKKNKFDEQLVEDFFNMIVEVWEPDNTELTLHIADVALPELFLNCGGDAPIEVLCAFMRAFARCMANTNDDTVTERLDLVALRALVDACQTTSRNRKKERLYTFKLNEVKKR